MLEILTALVLGIVVQALMRSTDGLSEAFVGLVRGCCDMMRWNSGWNNVTVLNRRCYMQRMPFGTNVEGTSSDADVISSVEKFLVDRETYGNSVMLTAQNVANKLSLGARPRGTVWYDGLGISFDLTRERMGDMIMVTNRMDIRSKRSTASIERWMSEVHEKWYAECNKEENLKNCVLKQIRSGPSQDGAVGHPLFDKYTMTDATSFDDIYLDEKHTVMRLVDKFRSGELRKLSLLLHGRPGCGKTSTIRAVANALDAVIIEVKLSNIDDDTQLFRIFSSDTLSYDRVGMAPRVVNVPLRKRVYVLEDIDAESDVVKQREERSPEPRKKRPRADGDEPSVEDRKRGITLAGLLSALDGIVPLGSVVIMTTNRVHKLDDALIRHGRVNARIEFSYMTASNANAMIRAKFPEYAGKALKDGEISPAALEAFLLCDDLSEVEEKIRRHLEGPLNV